MKKILTAAISVALVAGMLAACNKNNDGTAQAPASGGAAASAPSATSGASSAPAAAQPTANAPSASPGIPDVGKIQQVKVSSSGYGITPGAAINDALKTAVMQVNGTVVNAASGNLNTVSHVTADVDIQTNQGTDSAQVTAVVQGQHFAEMIISESHGLVSSFKVVKMTPPANKGDQFAVDIEAQIAKYAAPADAGKIKVVVAPLYTSKTAFNIGGRMVPARDVLNNVHQQIVDALSQTGRFTVLDRQFDGALQGELDMIQSGTTVNTDFAKLGQALSADLVWVGVINDFSYDKHVRHLQTSTRDLVSFSGGWSMSHRLINLSTRQIFQSGTLQGTPPSIGATTLGTGFDESSTLKNMEADVVKKISESILLRTFPVSVVDRDGNNVVLSQGGSALAEKGRYAIYLQGKELKDPQTGQSLGRMENLCCEVVISRVTPTLSYGVLENVSVKLDGVAPGSLIVHESLPQKAVADAAAAPSEPDPAPKHASAKHADGDKPAKAAGESSSKDW